MSETKTQDTWAAGEKYEPFIGRWSRLVAREFLTWLAVPADRDWADIGCGTGALTEVILDTAAPRSVKGIEPSDFIEHAQANIRDPRATFQRGDAQSLPLEAKSVDAAVAGLVLNFLSDPVLGAREMARVTRPGGIVAAYVWDYAGKMELLRYFFDAVVTLDPDMAAHDEGKRFPICKPNPLAEVFLEAGLRDVKTHPIDIPTHFKNFEDYWNPFLGGQGPAPSYVVSLDYERQTILRDFIRSRIPKQKDGTIQLIARAWAVRGRVA